MTYKHKEDVMTQRAEVVIIGAGIIGCSIAYFLSKKGFKDIVVLDKGGISSGVTGICPGGVRQQWGTEINCLLAKHSVQFFKSINEELQPNEPIPYRQVGYMFLFHSEQTLSNYEKQVALQNRLGIPTNILTPSQAADIVPQINQESFLAASFCETDGFLDDAYHVANSFAQAAKRNGVTFMLAEASRLIAENDRIVAVETSKGRIDCGLVVNAAGVDSPPIAATVGVEIPIKKEIRRILYTNRIEERLIEPLLVSFETGFAGKQLTDGAIYMSYLGPDLKPPYNSFDFQMKVAEAGMDIVPALEQIEFRSHLDGTYDSTPDHQAILGDVRGLDGYYQAIGMSGHGFMVAPAIGRCMAESIAGETPFIDISVLHFDRFKKNELIPEPSVV
jgi:sarcosine oxidase subunit beta